MRWSIVRGVALVGSVVLAAGAFVRPAIAQTGLPPDAPFTVATFFGGSAGDYARAVATDADGYVYIAGDTESPDFPWTARLYTGPTASRLAFVLKLTPDGSRVVFATLIGPAVLYDLAVDVAGHAYVAGETYASDFPMVNAFQPLCSSCDRGYHSMSDAVVAKLDPSGAALVYSTYLGSEGGDRAAAIAVDSAGRAVVVGEAEVGRGSDFPVVNTPAWSQAAEGPWRPTGFVAIFSPDGDTLEMVARLHASVGDVAVDAHDRIHLTGRVEAEPGIPLVRPTQILARGSDAFAMRVAPNGATLEFSTLVGGSGDDGATSLAVAPDGDIVIAGYTFSEDLATQGAWQTTLQTQGDAFVARLDPETPAVRYASYLGGGTWQDIVRGLAVDALGRAFVVGTTSSIDFPAVPPATDPARTTSIFVGAVGGQSVVPAHVVGPSATPSCFASSPAEPGLVYAGSYVGLLRSVDGGHTWAFVEHPLTADRHIEAIAVPPGAAHVVYAIATRLTAQLVKTTNAGQDWTVVDLPTSQSPNRVVADPFDPETVYVGAADEWLRSRDGGDTWVRIDGGIRGPLVTHPHEPGRLFRATWSGLYTSTTRGDSWSLLNGALREDGMLHVSRADAATMYLLTWQALHRTADGGRVWERVLGNPGGVHRQLALGAQDPNVLWLGGLDGLFRSGDGGRTLTKVTSIPDQVYVSALSTHAASPHALHVGVALWELDAFFSILSPLGDALEYSARVGGAGLDVLWNVAVAPDGAAWMVGWAGAPGLPVAGAIKPSPQGDADLYAARFDGAADHDNDGLPTWWEIRTGLDPHVPNADDDDDGDGLTNAEEFERGTHPRGLVQRYLAEGVTGSFFETRVNVVNPRETETASVQLRFLTDAGETVSEWLRVPPRTRRAVTLNRAPGLANAAVSTTIESDVLVAVDRTVTWDAAGYGAHAGQAVEAPASAWYFAEGATTSGFELYYLVENPNPVAARVTFTWLPGDDRGEVVRDYDVPPLTRLTIRANDVPGLAHAEISLIVTTEGATPVVVERAMYRHAPGQPYAAGHGGAGVLSPAATWSLAEGATGPFFDLFVLVANPSFSDAHLEVRYLLPDGRVIVKPHVARARQRLTIWVDLEDPALVDTAVSTTVTSVEGVLVVVERAMWWPGPTYHTWYGAHVAAGTTTPASAWALADGEAGGLAETYVLLGNFGAVGGDVRVTLLFDDGATAEQTVWLAPHSRTTVSVLHDAWTYSTASILARLASGAHFGVIVEALDPALEFVVEGAVYRSGPRQPWASGRCTLATPLLSR
ncbi:MAG: SBBP repeat-containing protein [Acidobacteria bacterium]|nr:SBBP repeat-containing protein [Acidobacteriota bacterium]